MSFDFDIALEQLKLGNLTAQPQRVTGGYLHKVFRLETTTGKYALKLLNPVIMKRLGVLDNYKRAEQIEAILSDHDIPIVPALVLNGARMQHLAEQYFYIFQWTDAKALGWHEIKEEHCRMAGELLAQIHKIPLHENGGVGFGTLSVYDSPDEVRNFENIQCGMPFGYDISERKFHIAWDSYIIRAEKMHSELAEELLENQRLLYQAQEDFNAAVDSVPDIVCISDGDMDSKNVLWENGKPLIIDLESLDYGNPFMEMFQLALDWAGGTVCNINIRRLDAFLKAYQSVYGEVAVDWKALSGAGFFWLDWLEYNTKRALLIECGDEEEQKLGIREAKETMRRIVYYHSVREKLLTYRRNL